MLKVRLTGPLRAAAADQATVELEAVNIRDLMTRLLEMFPDLQQQMDTGIAVAIDGEIYRDNWGTPIPENCEIVLLPRIPGG